MPTATGPSPRRQWVTPADAVDLFVYVVVLNLAAEYLPGVIVETFTVSLVTALLLKVVLEVVLVAKKRMVSRVRSATTPARKVGGGLLLWVLVAGSKFLILWIEDLVFGDAVHLGGFFAVTLLVVSLLLARAGVRSLLALPVAEPSAAAEPSQPAGQP